MSQVLSEALVADQGFRQHPGGAGLHGFLAARAVLLLQPVEQALGLRGRAVEDAAVARDLRLQRAAAVGTAGAHRDRLHPIGRVWIERLAPKRAILTHMTAEMDYSTLRRDLPTHIEPAYDGMVVDF